MIQWNTPALQRYRKWRYTKDSLTSGFIRLGGIAALVAILSIFLYLIYEVVPLFKPVDVQQQASYTHQQAVAPSRLILNDAGDTAMRLNHAGNKSIAEFFNVNDGQLLQQVSLPIVGDSHILVDGAHANRWASVSRLGELLIAQANFRALSVNVVDNDEALIEYPYGRDVVMLEDNKQASLFSLPSVQTLLAYRDGDDVIIVAAATGENNIVLWRLSKHIKAEQATLRMASKKRVLLDMSKQNDPVIDIAIGGQQKWLYVLTAKQLKVFDIQRVEQAPVLVDAVDLSDQLAVQLSPLLGGVSYLVSHESGMLSQWFMSRDANNVWRLNRVRDFSLQSAPSLLLAEQHRKGFLTLSALGELNVFYASSQRHLKQQRILQQSAVAMALSPRADTLLVDDGRSYHVFDIENKHPEMSWSALWQSVWYEHYPEPDYVWQSSSSTNDYEPKYSLAPLVFGTLKAAFYAMLLATPLAVLGAIYTAYFMAPALRQKIKPLIELMEALPTVILGFIAGLWLAPFMESYLAAVFSILIFLPLGIVVFAWLYKTLPKNITFIVPTGWESLVLIPVIIAIISACFAGHTVIEDFFFGGNMRVWVSDELGLGYDQRNAMIVGMAMGFAVVPTIFSMAEDAIFSVPQHLSRGALALGATPWQTLLTVVLPTASPGIFSALMIGLGRAVGETMIVLMATGNTPIMDANIFEGMRTLAANLAVEIPEAEIGGTHYRILFLSALILFLFTFVVNTIAEIVRVRLRKQYAQI